VGKAIAEKIDELLNTGKLEFLEKLKSEVPEELAGWLPVPGMGPKKIAMIWKELGITALSDLETAAKKGKLRDLPGMGAKSESAILEGIASLARRTGRIPLGRAYPLAQEIIETLKGVKGVVAAEPAGSLRRMRSTVGDLDILVAAKDSSVVMEAFVNLPRVSRVLGKGEFKSSIEFTDGVRAQVWVHPPREFGTALQYATGSKDHNVQLRQIALDKGLSLSDHSFKKGCSKGRRAG
jgi:DNA polymerase (family 10)